LKVCQLKDGMTVSFHHQLRNGDFVVNQTLAAIKELGVKDIRLAQTALFTVHQPVIDYIKEGIVSRIEGSLNDTVGDYVSKHPLKSPVILRSHGGDGEQLKQGSYRLTSQSSLRPSLMNTVTAPVFSVTVRLARFRIRRLTR